jgi:hypothetical protein
MCAEVCVTSCGDIMCAEVCVTSCGDIMCAEVCVTSCSDIMCAEVCVTSCGDIMCVTLLPCCVLASMLTSYKLSWYLIHPTFGRLQLLPIQQCHRWYRMPKGSYVAAASYTTVSLLVSDTQRKLRCRCFPYNSATAGDRYPDTQRKLRCSCFPYNSATAGDRYPGEATLKLLPKQQCHCW